jgi:hypothetical protein
MTVAEESETHSCSFVYLSESGINDIAFSLEFFSHP